MIPAHDESPRLPALLAAITRQVKSVEIAYVDDGSCDAATPRPSRLASAEVGW